MPRTPDEFPGTRMEDSICFYDQYGAMPDCYGGILYSDGYFYARDNYGDFNLRHPETLFPEPHAYTHISGGADPIDGDKINIDFTPSYYIPILSPEVDAYDELTAHLAGIDAYLGNLDSYLSDLDAYFLNEPEHRTLRHLIHFIDDGPGDGFASGAYKEIIPYGYPWPTTEIWYTSVAKNKKIVELNLTRDSNKKPLTEEWKIYDHDGITVLTTVTDSITYQGPYEISRTRTIT